METDPLQSSVQFIAGQDEWSVGIWQSQSRSTRYPLLGRKRRPFWRIKSRLSGDQGSELSQLRPEVKLEATSVGLLQKSFHAHMQGDTAHVGATAVVSCVAGKKHLARDSVQEGFGKSGVDGGCGHVLSKNTQRNVTAQRVHKKTYHTADITETRAQQPRARTYVYTYTYTYRYTFAYTFTTSDACAPRETPVQRFPRNHMTRCEHDARHTAHLVLRRLAHASFRSCVCGRTAPLRDCFDHGCADTPVFFSSIVRSWRRIQHGRPHV